jgi:hypothetical protein
MLTLQCLSLLTAKKSWSFELKVTNQTKGKIYTTLTSGNSIEDFGVVAIGRSATVGFSSSIIGDRILVSWEEGVNHDLTSATIDSSSLFKLRKDVSMVQLIYSGNRTWILKAFDKNNREIGSIP